MESLENILKDGADYIKKEFGLSLDTSILKYYSDEEWKEFCEINEFNPTAEGIYVPGGKAYVRDSPAIASNIFHEVYGHVLFCEYSVPGKILLDKQKQGIAKEFLKAQSETPFTLTGSNLTDYEGFAMWMESVICKETGRADVWEKKKENMHQQYKELWNYFASAEKKLTKYGLMAQMGFPKQYDSAKVVNVLKNIYDKNFDNIELILAYGSKKPTSDIDIFVISKNNSTTFYNGWLDIYELNMQHFNELSEKLDISVTDPIMTGELIYGNPKKLKDIKEKIINMPITRQAIDYNMQRSIAIMKDQNLQTIKD